ncbi:uncharacterized protein BX663DRAFT_500490 [Cokeromyces recurvatus]|uniref:uncharacterized protein n=1 Tax=Cokeromyces recurvatus TaxID=90255 RepID=UPI00221E699A|nr:uncharacterized protein BX663DRAFT_500490 [Cokeromyces recurvatus]KAI7905653.1 hypothetical protein BX663DRAFT_500490 [Cokeromyces recurvatus]
MMKPARVQVTKAQLEEYLREKRPEGGTYNIWHHRYSGLERDFHRHSVRPKFKVDIARDSGETLGSRNKNAYFCIYFAKGMCALGPKCPMWHRIPNESDLQETTVDCFGRDKFTEFRQDMGGVGGFMRENRTLYVGRIAINEDTEGAVVRQFGQFGPLEKVRILRGRGVAFVTYRSRSNAEFAREAMMNQSLENNEIMNVRWATADPKAVEEDEIVYVPNEVKLEKERMERLRTEISESYERFDAENKTAAENVYLKRDLIEDGSNELEPQTKKQKGEDDSTTEQNPYEYTEEDCIRYYEEQAYYEQLQQQQQQQQKDEENNKAGGIIPQNVLANLKTISKNTVTMKKPINTGLENLTSYGSSDSEEED